MSDKDKDNITSIFDRFSPSKPATPSTSTGLKPYLAVETTENNERAMHMRVNFSNGEVMLFNYNLMTTVISVVPELVSILFTSGSVDLRGRNLRELLSDIQKESVRVFQPFDAERHEAPKENTPIIESIAWQSYDEIIDWYRKEREQLS